MTNQLPTEGQLPPMLSTRQAADFVGMDRKSIYRLIEAGDLPAVRFGPRCIRIRREDLLAMLTPVAKGPQHAARKRN